MFKSGGVPLWVPSGGDFGDLEYICGKRNESQHGLRQREYRIKFNNVIQTFLIFHKRRFPQPVGSRLSAQFHGRWIMDGETQTVYKRRLRPEIRSSRLGFLVHSSILDLQFTDQPRSSTLQYQRSNSRHLTCIGSDVKL